MENAFGSAIITILLCAVLFILLFLICREIICWYWKINKMVENQDTIIKLLTQIANNTKPQESKTDTPKPTTTGFKVGDVAYYGDKKVVIKDITDNGLYSCYSNRGLFFEGDLAESDLKPVEE